MRSSTLHYWLALATALGACATREQETLQPQILGACATDDAGIGSEEGENGGLPCDVAPIIEKYCGDCHGASTSFGAPMSLATAEDFHLPAPSDEDTPVYEQVYERVNATGSRRMPPASVSPPSAAELDALNAWLEGGAEPGSGSCEPEEEEEEEEEEETPQPSGSGGAEMEPIDYDDPELECYNLTAFATPFDKTEPYSVPTTPDYYVAFTMNAPWQGIKYARSFRSIIDNDAVLHHWLFFKNLVPVAEGVQGNALGAHPDGEMLYGWAPGGSDMYMHKDVGIEMSGDNSYLLELHYNNTTGGAVPDASGLEVCVTPTRPEHVSQLTWVGTDAIAGFEATGYCAPTNTEPVRIFTAQPHMHTKGQHMKVVVTRTDGTEEVIHDEPFSFDYQRGYLFDVTINPGDTITTHCTYSDFAIFGKGTNDEMCYFFTQSWPAGALSAFGIGTLIHGPNSCLD